jgi:biopolymer transport protein ExbB/TolQ
MIHRGGPVMYVILTLSVVLYSECFRLILSIWRSTREIGRLASGGRGVLPRLHATRDELHEELRQRRIALGAMIAAAPLLGLLGTVSGMVLTFTNLSGHAADKTMEVLARGISEVLVATESGLIVAIPALLLVLIANRGLRKAMQRISATERRFRLLPQP